MNNKIKNIILDVGGVILNIDYHRSVVAFEKLGGKNFDEIYSQKQQTLLFSDYETGKITDEIFRDGIRNLLQINATDEEIDDAWNAMLLNVPSERLKYIESLSNRYLIYSFSNTNPIHMKVVNQRVMDANQERRELSKFFMKTYYSYQFGFRKPEPESFKKIIALNGLKENETLFIDDSLQHVLGAKKAGLHSIHLTKDVNLMDLDKLINQMR